MMSKKLSKALAVLGAVGLLAGGYSFAQSQNPGQPSQPGQMGPKYGQKSSGAKIDPQKAQAFCKEVQPLWQRMWQIKNEIRAQWRKNPPDWSEIERKEQELAKIRLEIHKKAYEMGLPYGPRSGLGLRRICNW